MKLHNILGFACAISMFAGNHDLDAHNLYAGNGKTDVTFTTNEVRSLLSTYGATVIVSCIASILLISRIFPKTFFYSAEGWDGNPATATGRQWLASIGLAAGVFFGHTLIAYCFVSIDKEKINKLKQYK